MRPYALLAAVLAASPAISQTDPLATLYLQRGVDPGVVIVWNEEGKVIRTTSQNAPLRIGDCVRSTEPETRVVATVTFQRGGLDPAPVGPEVCVKDVGVPGVRDRFERFIAGAWKRVKHGVDAP